MMILMLDNYDSFTYNLVHYMQELGETVRVERNDKTSIEAIKKLNPQKIIISPGPGAPNEAGITLQLIDTFKFDIPILGICLGHQAIGQYFGGWIVHAREVVHGKTSMIRHNNTGVFNALKNPLEATRYHSLIIDKNSLPNCLEMTAWTTQDDGSIDEIMGIKHRDLPIQGVQFHPESILSEAGHALLRNF